MKIRIIGIVLGLIVVLAGCGAANEGESGAVAESVVEDKNNVSSDEDGQSEGEETSKESEVDVVKDEATKVDDEATNEATQEATDEATQDSNDSESDEYQDYIDVELVDKDGNVAKISDYEGKFIVLNFFGVWCHFCMEEMPDLEKVYSEYEGDDFVILLVNATTTEKIGQEGVKKWYEEGGYTMPMVMDLDGIALDTYPVSGFPTSYFINKEGKVLGALTGGLTEETLLTILKDFK